MTGTAPQEAQADPQMVTCFQCRGDGTCFATDDPCPVCGGLGSITDDAAPVPQTERECPDCKGDRAGYKASCPTCSGTGKEKA